MTGAYWVAWRNDIALAFRNIANCDSDQFREWAGLTVEAEVTVETDALSLGEMTRRRAKP